MFFVVYFLMRCDQMIHAVLHMKRFFFEEKALTYFYWI